MSRTKYERVRDAFKQFCAVANIDVPYLPTRVLPSHSFSFDVPRNIPKGWVFNGSNLHNVAYDYRVVPRESPPRHVEYMEELAGVDRMLGYLREACPKWHNILCMRYAIGYPRVYTYGEIARKLGMSRGMVRYFLSRAIKLLQRKFCTHNECQQSK